MIAVWLSPIYVLWNMIQLIWILRWMQACSGIFHTVIARTAVALGYALLASSLLLACFLPVSCLQRLAKRISNYWLGVLLYMTLTIGAALLLRVSLYRLHFAGREFLFSGRGFVASGAACMAIIVAISLWGSINARILHVTDYEVTVKKDCGGLASLRIALVSDLHMGYSIGQEEILRVVEKINAQNADLVVIAGDLFDNDYGALDDPDALAEILSGIKSCYGVYACYGNHDIQEPILAGFTFSSDEKKQSDPRMDALLEQADIRLLRDEAVLIDNKFYVYGRPDQERPGKGIDAPKTPEKITAGLDLTKPVIVIDHEPRELAALSEAGADLDLSGHTHAGQLFPGNLLVKLKWENAYGCLKKGDMYSIVTSGAGVFGPFMRVGTKAEICVIDVKFT